MLEAVFIETDCFFYRVVFDTDPHFLLQASAILADVHVIVAVRFHLGVFLAPDLPVDATWLAVPPLAKKILFFVLVLVNQTHENFAVGADVLHGDAHEKFDIWVLGSHWVLAVDDAVLIAVMPFVHNALVKDF